MNVFVLCTGRCGSVTFLQACRHLENFSVGHESRMNKVRGERLDFPGQHIEIDNRLCYCLGALDEKYGDDAFYVHLVRDANTTAGSFLTRWGAGVIHGYSHYILQKVDAYNENDPFDVCLDYVENLNANIRLFLKDKTRVATVHLESAAEDFGKFWDMIGAEGDKRAALEEWKTAYNAS